MDNLLGLLYVDAMRRLTLAILLLVPIAAAYGESPTPAKTHKSGPTLVAPLATPAPPPPRRIPPPPEMVAAAHAAHEGAALLRSRLNKQAVAHFLNTLAASPATPPVYSVNEAHLQMLVRFLTNRGLAAEAERAVAAFLAQPPPGTVDQHASSLAGAVDLGLYLAAGRNDVEKVLSLLGRRSAIAGRLEGACPAQRYFPEVVAPTHHDRRVAARLADLGCPREIIEQLDELASKPMGGDMFGPNLPPRVPASSPPPR